MEIDVKTTVEASEGVNSTKDEIFYDDEKVSGDKTNEIEDKVKTTSSNASTEVDPYFYTKRDEFTSEIYKIEIGGLPVKFGFGQLKKLLNKKLKLNSHKIKSPGQNAKWAFVTFRCEDDRERALKTLQGYKWKGKTLSVKKANPAADPLVKKRTTELNDDEQAVKKVKLNDDDGLSDSERLKKAVSPLWNIPYEDQLKIKETEIKRFLITLGRKIQSICGCPVWLQNQRKKNNLCCDLNPIRPSPVTNSYRNKCEFNIGLAPDGITRNVGFRISSYSAGSMTVMQIDDCDIISQNMKNVVQHFQNYIRSSDKMPFNPENHSGYWRQLTVRTNKNGDVLIIVVIHPQDLSKEDLETLKKEIAEYFQIEDSSCRVASIYFQSFAKRLSGSEPVLEHLFGEKFIYETICDLQFRISPDAFFQINSSAAEFLYNEIKELINANENTVVIDVCCGTGTIGMILAKDVNKVIGIEMVPSAIEDAKANAELNGIKNIEFICGKAEDVLISTLASVNTEEIVAVVDPPRAGLHNRVIRTLRSCDKIKRLIYVSCSPKSAMLNFEDLTRPVSNQYRGSPFIPISATPVDLFPQTNHCELVILFQRSS